MDANEYYLMRDHEEKYWWYRALRELVWINVERLTKSHAGACILDAGCGTGGNLKRLRDHLPKARLYGIDVEPVAVAVSRERNVADIQQSSVSALPFEDGFFDIVISLDVLYFKGVDDQKAMQEFFRVLKPGGRLILNLPAFEFLKGSHDIAVSTQRRYSRSSVRRLMTQSGFMAEHMSYWNMILFPFLLVMRPISRLLARSAAKVHSDLGELPGFLNNFLTWLFLNEVRFADRFALPLGSSIFARARKENKG